MSKLKEELEFRDKYCKRPETYWKTRARCQAQSLPCLGTREHLIKSHEAFAFNSENHIPRASSEDLEKLADTPLENFASQKWITHNVKLSNDTSRQLATSFPWKVLPEIAYMNKKIAPVEVLKALGPLMRPTFCFYNHFPETGLQEKVIGLVFLPFTPDFLSKAPESLIRQLAGALGLTSAVGSQELQQVLERQKLLEVVYAVLDSEALHGVTYCQTYFSQCRLPASSLCDNFMCSSCCSLHQNRSACHIHDRPVQFERFRARSLYEFEEHLDRNSCVRLVIREPLRKVQLYRVFEGYPVRWDKTVFWHNPVTHKIQHVYLTFVSSEDASAAYLNRKELAQKTNLNFVIEHLPENLNTAVQRFTKMELDPQNILLIKEGPLRKGTLLPSKTQIIPEFTRLVTQITGLQDNQFKLEVTYNPLSQNYSVREFYICFPDSESTDTFYNAQPYFSHHVAHKLSHLIPFPFLKNSSICTTCTRTKECVHDLCSECCSRFASHPSYFCKDHTVRPVPPLPISSMHNRRLLELKPSLLVAKTPEKVAKFHMMLRHLLEEGVYTWFKPTFYRNPASMKSANFELQQVVDSSTPRQNIAAAFNKKDGKLFNFVSSPPYASELDGKLLTEGIDTFGNTFMEYTYEPYQPYDISHDYSHTHYNPNQYTRQDFIEDTSHPGYELRNNCHLFLAGLNPYKKGLKEQVAKEIRNKLGRIMSDDVIFIDKNSLTANMLLMDPNVETHIETYHRIAAVKLQNETDAIKLILGEANLALPLSNGHVGSPIIIPSAELCSYIHTQYEEFMRNPSHSIPPESISLDKLPQPSKKR